MRVAILETVKTSAGFEQEFDRLVFDELKKEHTFLKCDEHCAIIDSVDKKSTDRSNQKIH